MKVGQSTSVPMSTVDSSLVQNTSAAAAAGMANPLQPAGGAPGTPGRGSLTSAGIAAATSPQVGMTALAALVSGTGSTAGAASTTPGTTSSGTATSGASPSTASAVAAQETISSGTPPALSSASSDISGAATSSGPTTLVRPPRPAAGIVRLRDIARVEMGAASYTQAQTFDGHQAVGIAVFQLPDTNALDVADRVKAKMKELEPRFPEGIKYEIAYDITPFIRESVWDVVKTLFEAVFLVGLVVLAFLQNWRSVLIPMVAVPVAIIGTFAAMAVMRYSLNNISLFGLVLAIGIVVDDAIVVVENVDRWLDHGLPPREAARKAMTEVTGPIIAVALVLCAVFVPCAFISGITGRFFKQFAVTIAVSTVFSAINSLTLSPALAAILLGKKKRREIQAIVVPPTLGAWCPAGEIAGDQIPPECQITSAEILPENGTSNGVPLGRHAPMDGGSTRWSLLWSPVSAALGLFARGFNAAFGRTTAAYAWSVGKLLHVNVAVLLLYAALLVLTLWIFNRAPRGFVPQQDQGRVIVSIQLPDAASLERTRETLAEIDKIARGDPKDPKHYPGVPGVAHTITVGGYSFVQQANGSNFASMFIVLDPFDKRTTPALRDTAIMNNLRRQWSQKVKGAQVLVFGSPPVPGLSVAGGFKLVVEDPAGLGLPILEHETKAVVDKLSQAPGLVGVSSQFRANTPELFMDIDRAKAAALGVSFNDLNQTLGINLGSLYVNSFNAFGRHWQVNVQAQGEYRNRLSDIHLLAIRNNQGQMVPLGTLVEMRDIGGPIFVYRYNSRAATSVTGSLKPGVSSGNVIADVDQHVRRDVAAVDENRMDGTDVHADPRRRHHAGGLLPGCDVRFPGPLGALRKLVAAAGRDPGGAVVHALFRGRRAGDQWGSRHLRADRPGGAGGLGLQEFDPRGRVCPGLARRGPVPLRGHGGGLAHTAAADPHDLLRLHPGRAPPGDRHGRRVRNAALAGNGRLQRHDRRDTLRHLPHPRLLLCHSGPQRTAVLRHRRGPGGRFPAVRRAVRDDDRIPAVAHRVRRRADRPTDDQVLAVACLGRKLARIGRSRRRGGNSRRPGGLRHSSPHQALEEGVAMISHFFIDRPIFASVCSIVFVLAGLVAWWALPVAQYPEVTPPTVLVTALYPGANAYTVRDTVAAPIEESVNGVEGMMYMSSQSTNDGTYRLSVTFKLGFPSDMAQVLVQNRVSLALPVIPALVQNEGINVKKVSPNTLMIVNLISPPDPQGRERYDATYLSNYATIYIRDELSRLDGVADVGYLGQRDYSLRAWIDPNKLATLGLTAADVVAAIAQQNLQVAAGQIGQEPVPKGQQFQLTINTLGRLVDPEQFADIIVKAGSGGQASSSASSQGGGGTSTGGAASSTGGSTTETQTLPPATGIVRLRDVARVVLGSQQYEQSCTLNGKPSVALSVYQLPGSNALKTAEKVYDKMKELQTRFPPGIEYRIVYDTTPFIQESVNDVYYTLGEAIILVTLVVLAFLQNWRAALIPMVAVPVAIIGTFAFMAALKFSLNNLSLFGLVLAIGIVVDDAIVVVENIERWLEKGVEPREAAHKAMEEVTGPVIAVALVLFAVFVPAAFLSGITGEFFRQFAVTIAVSTVISAFNSLTLSPALAAILLRPRGAHRDPLTWLLDHLLGWFFWLFNRVFGACTAFYVRLVGGFLRVSLLVLLLYAGLLGVTYWQFIRAGGVHPPAGQGLPGAQRATARFRLGPAHAKHHGANRGPGPRYARGCRHGGYFRPVADRRRQRAEPGFDVHHA